MRSLTHNYMNLFEEDKKWCNLCKKYKNFTEFHKSKSKKFGLASNCKCCCSLKKRNKEWKDNSNIKRKEKYHSDLEFRSKILQQRALYRKEKVSNVMLEQAKQRSKKFNLDFNISLEDIIIPEYCPILNIKLEKNSYKFDSSPSLDRIDNTKGYIKGNVAVISSLANTMKNKANINQLILFCEKMPKYLNQINNDIVRPISKDIEVKDKEPLR